jgi:probable HAF family extracellular repeat protein
MNPSRMHFGAAAVFVFSAVGLALGDVSFQGIGYVPGYGSTANAVSATGTFAVGNGGHEGFGSADTEALLWTQASGITFLGDLPGTHPTHNFAMDVSADGNVVVGEAKYAGDYIQNLFYEAFRWTPATGMVGLGFLPGGTRSSAAAVSADGSIIVGQGFTAADTNEAFRWTEAGGMQGLGGLISGGTSFAFGISPNGARVVGAAYNGTRTDAAYWTTGGGWQSIGKLPGGLDGLGAFATDASTDGSVIIGNSSSTLVPFSFEAFRWTESGGMQGLGLLQPDHNLSTTTAVSGDGSIVVGISGPFSGADRKPFIWDETHGMRELRVVLESEYGLDLTGWSLTEVLDISEDGNTFVGYGTDPQGITEGWIATIPEPSTLSLLAVGGLLAARRRRA